MSWKLQVVILAFLVVGAAMITWMLNSSMPPAQFVEDARQAAERVHSQLLLAESQPKLPSLANSWMRFQDSMSACVVTVTPFPSKDKDSGTPHWDAGVEGATGAVFTCLTMAAQALPLVIDEVHVKGEKALVAVRLYGNAPEMPARAKPAA